MYLPTLEALLDETTGGQVEPMLTWLTDEFANVVAVWRQGIRRGGDTLYARTGLHPQRELAERHELTHLRIYFPLLSEHANLALDHRERAAVEFREGLRLADEVGQSISVAAVLAATIYNPALAPGIAPRAVVAAKRRGIDLDGSTAMHALPDDIDCLGERLLQDVRND